MHSFQLEKKMFQILPHFTSYMYILKPSVIGFALHVPRTKGHSFKSGTSFVELAVNGRIGIYNEERQIFSNPGGGGGRGDVSPHVFSGGGHNIKCPPPPPRSWGRMNFGRYNVVF